MKQIGMEKFNYTSTDCVPIQGSPQSSKIKCVKQNQCTVAGGRKGFGKLSFDSLSNLNFISLSDPKHTVKCDECAAWNCLINGTGYGGSGCKGDDNACKNGSNQDVAKYHDASSVYVTCQNSSDPSCAQSKIDSVRFWIIYSID